MSKPKNTAQVELSVRILRGRRWTKDALIVTFPWERTEDADRRYAELRGMVSKIHAKEQKKITSK